VWLSSKISLVKAALLLICEINSGFIVIGQTLKRAQSIQKFFWLSLDYIVLSFLTGFNLFHVLDLLKHVKISRNLITFVGLKGF